MLIYVNYDVMSSFFLQLPGIEMIQNYSFRYGRSPHINLPLAVNPTGCARTEPKRQARFRLVFLSELTSKECWRNKRIFKQGYIANQLEREWRERGGEREIKYKWRLDVIISWVITSKYTCSSCHFNFSIHSWRYEWTGHDQKQQNLDSRGIYCV